jgi:hypothetical protein
MMFRIFLFIDKYRTVRSPQLRAATAMITALNDAGASPESALAEICKLDINTVEIWFKMI